MTKVVVTGGAGFVGSHLVDALVTRGDEVHVIDTWIAGKAKNRINPRAVYHENFKETLGKPGFLSNVEVIFHLAALPCVQDSIYQPLNSFEINVAYTAHLLECARAYVKRVVFASSSSVYGMAATTPISEKCETMPLSPYAAHKLMCESLCEAYMHTYGLETVCLRYFNIYGPRLQPTGPYAAVVAVFLDRWRKGLPIEVTGDGAQTRDFVHVSDVVKATIQAAFSDEVGAGEVINVGSGRGVTIKDLATLVGGTIAHIPERASEPKHSVAAIVRARILLKWTPSVQLKDGIEELKRLNS